MLFMRRCFCTRRQWRLSLSLVKVEAVIIILVLLYLFSFWFESNGSPDISRISEVQDEIRNLNVDDFQFQGEDGDIYRNNDEATSNHILIHLNNSIHSNFNDKAVTHNMLLPVLDTSDIKTKTKPKDLTILKDNYIFNGPSKTNRYLFILGHYEQLGKTTINFFHARYMASLINRDLIIPYVRNSRFCGLHSGWIGPKRKKSREFISMENYFDMSSIEELSPVSHMSRLAHLDEYHSECSLSGIAMIYFIYAVNKLETKRYLHLSDSEYENLVIKMSKHNGWYDCSFIEKKLHSSKRMNNIRLSQAICVDPEIIVSINALEELIHNKKCAAIFLWRGIGSQRTHFNLTFPELHAYYLSQIEFSALVMEEADKFLFENFLSQSYISIQIRSERQLAWYSIKKFKQCLDLVVKVVNILILKKEIKHVFISSDLEKHGSDQISLLLNTTTQDEAKQYFYKTVKMLNAVLYRPDKSRGLIYNDAGFVALTGMEILSRSRHLVTVGDGTFQRWLVARFKKHKKKLKRSWSLTRVCATELKRVSSKGSVINPVDSQAKN